MSEKRLMLLGGSRYLIPVIDIAHRLGLFVITVDYLPHNVAHSYSDEYCNVSIIDKASVLATAREKRIDGIMSFACDPGVETAAYVAEELGLPFQCSYRSTCILQNKGLFRKFLSDNSFNVPQAKSFSSKDDPIKEINSFSWPVIVKPVDSAGSKGVSKVDSPENLAPAIVTALKASFSGRYIIEEYIEIEGARSSADPFSVGGILKYNFYSDQRFDSRANNPFIPDKIIFPSSMSDANQNYLTSEIERLFCLLKIGDGIFNIEVCVGLNGKPYIMEVSPRGGGNSIAEEQRMAYGVNLIENEVRRSVGMSLIDFEKRDCDGVWCNYAIHCRNNQSGRFKSIKLDPEVENRHVKYMGLSVKPGDFVGPFIGSNDCIGDVFLRFGSVEEMNQVIDGVDNWLTVVVE